MQQKDKRELKIYCKATDAQRPQWIHKDREGLQLTETELGLDRKIGNWVHQKGINHIKETGTERNSQGWHRQRRE